MKKTIPQVEIRVLNAGKLHGFLGQTTPETLRKDIPALSARYQSLLESRAGHLLPLYVLTRDPDPSGRCTLFFGGPKPHPGLESIEMPAGPYARIVVRPKYGLFWDKAIAETKQWFYSQWLPNSPYRALDIIFEHHTEHTTAKQPTLELFFALEKIQK